MAGPVLNLSKVKSELRRKGLNYKVKNFDIDDETESVIFIDANKGTQVCGKIVRTFTEGEVVFWPSFRHENLAPLMDVLCIQNNLYIYLTTGQQITLKEIVHDETFAHDARCFERKRAFARGIFSGLAYLHAKSLCLMNLCDDNIVVSKSRDRAIITNFSHLVSSMKVSTFDLHVPELYKAPETGNEEFDAEPVEMWASGVLMLDMFLAHMIPWAVADYDPQRVVELVKTLSLELFQATNTRSNITHFQLKKFKMFLMGFFADNPSDRIIAMDALNSTFLQSKLKLGLHMIPEDSFVPRDAKCANYPGTAATSPTKSVRDNSSLNNVPPASVTNRPPFTKKCSTRNNGYELYTSHAETSINMPVKEHSPANDLLFHNNSKRHVISETAIGTNNSIKNYQPNNQPKETSINIDMPEYEDVPDNGPSPFVYSNDNRKIVSETTIGSPYSRKNYQPNKQSTETCRNINMKENEDVPANVHFPFFYHNNRKVVSETAVRSPYLIKNYQQNKQSTESCSIIDMPENEDAAANVPSVFSPSNNNHYTVQKTAVSLPNTANNCQPVKEEADSTTGYNYNCSQTKSLTVLNPKMNHNNNTVTIRLRLTRTFAYSNIALATGNEGDNEGGDVHLNRLHADEDSGRESEYVNADKETTSSNLTETCFKGDKPQARRSAHFQRLYKAPLNIFEKQVVNPETPSLGLLNTPDVREMIQKIIFLRNCYISVQLHQRKFISSDFAQQRRKLLNEYQSLLHHESLHLRETLKKRYALKMDDYAHLLKPLNFKGSNYRTQYKSSLRTRNMYRTHEDKGPEARKTEGGAKDYHSPEKLNNRNAVGLQRAYSYRTAIEETVGKLHNEEAKELSILRTRNMCRIDEDKVPEARKMEGGAKDFHSPEKLNNRSAVGLQRTYSYRTAIEETMGKLHNEEAKEKFNENVYSQEKKPVDNSIEESAKIRENISSCKPVGKLLEQSAKTNENVCSLESKSFLKPFEQSEKTNGKSKSFVTPLEQSGNISKQAFKRTRIVHEIDSTKNLEETENYIDVVQISENDVGNNLSKNERKCKEEKKKIRKVEKKEKIKIEKEKKMKKAENKEKNAGSKKKEQNKETAKDETGANREELGHPKCNFFSILTSCTS